VEMHTGQTNTIFIDMRDIPRFGIDRGGARGGVVG
jgi:hypothetical protein